MSIIRTSNANDLLRSWGAQGSTGPSPRRGRDPNLERTLLDFKLSHLLKAGPNGRVYKAHSTLSGRAIALKILRRGLRNVSGARDAFIREQHLLREFGDTVIPRLVGAGTLRDSDWYGMAVSPGTTLFELATSPGRVSVDWARLLLRMCRATEELHGMGLCHGGLSGSGLIVSEDLQRISLVDMTHVRRIETDADVRTDIAAVGELFLGLMPEADELMMDILEGCCSKRPRFRRASELTAFTETAVALMWHCSDPRPVGQDTATAVNLRYESREFAVGDPWNSQDDDVTAVFALAATA